MTLLAFDFGARRIGVAVGNTVSRTAREIGVLDVRSGSPDWAGLDKLITQWRPARLIVGDPATLDDGEQPIRKRARAFARTLAQRYRLGVEQIDERTSSIEAAQRFAQGRATGVRKRRDAGGIDALAAVVILERWFAEPGSRVPITLD